MDETKSELTREQQHLERLRADIERMRAEEAERKRQRELIHSRVQERMQGYEISRGDVSTSLPQGIHPASAYTERGTASRAETGAEKPEVKNFDAETRPPRPPEGWRPGGPEGKG